MCQGHPNAAGAFIDEEDFELFKRDIEECLMYYDFSINIEADIELAPNQIIIKGPRATLGKELSIETYGSIILYKVLLHQRIVAIKTLIKTDNPKLINNSYKVTLTCLNKEEFIIIEVIVLIILLGDEYKKVLIKLYLANNSHKIKKTAIINILKKLIINLFFLILFKNNLCSSLYMYI